MPFEFSHTEVRGLHPGRAMTLTWAESKSKQALSSEFSAGDTPGNSRMTASVPKWGTSAAHCAVH